MTLGERIRDCRQKANLTQEQVAEAMQITRQAVTKWESGQSAPSTENLFKLAELFGTTVDFLLTEAREPLPNPEPEPSESTASSAVPKHTWKDNTSFAFFIGLSYYGLFLVYKYFYCEIGLDYGLMYFLFDAEIRNLPYLFGWLLTSRMYILSAILSMAAALFGKPWVAVTTFAGFVLGLLLGEPLGKMVLTPWEAEIGLHHGWWIWLCIFLGGLALGILLQTVAGFLKRRKESKS